MARPRNRELDGRILAAAASCMAEHGYLATSMEEVARQAGVGKPAVYLRWRTKAHLMFELTISSATTEPLPDTGSLVQDLTIMLQRLGATLDTAPRTVMGDRIGEMIADHGFFAEVWERQAGPVAREVYGLWERAIDRGEVDPEAPGWRISNDLSYVVLWRHLVYHDPVAPGDLEELVHRNVDAALLS